MSCCSVVLGVENTKDELEIGNWKRGPVFWLSRYYVCDDVMRIAYVVAVRERKYFIFRLSRPGGLKNAKENTCFLIGAANSIAPAKK